MHLRCVLDLVVSLFLTGYVVFGSEEPLAVTKLGVYRGRYLSTISGLQVAAFNGIRYAQRPRRFQEAERVQGHEGEYDASDDGDDCLQISHTYNKYPFEESLQKRLVGSEDCLFLNVYTPSLNPAKRYSVMVWIHGGGYMIGTGASVFHGPQLLLEKEVILVTINYRLDIFGFLSYDDDVIPGNYGLKDQSLALRWVKENIEAFGGDPKSITIFGESAGASSVHLQMHSPRNKGVFHRAISQSGSIDCPWPLMSRTTARERALQVAAYLSCPTNPQDLLTCLQTKTPEELMETSLSLKKMKVKLEMIFKPVLESRPDGFIMERDLEKRSSLPWMGGVNSGEGLIFYTETCTAGDRNLSEFNRYHDVLMAQLFSYSSSPHADKITSMIKNHYVGDADFSEHTIRQFVDMFSDGMFLHGQLESVKKHKGKAYFYLFSHEGERSLTALNQLTDLKAGVCHADDLFYLFPFWKFFPKLSFNEADLKVQKLMVELWTNFAINGNPTSGMEEPKWLESEGGKYFATITSEGIQQSKNFYTSRMQFWDKLPTNLATGSRHQRDEL